MIAIKRDGGEHSAGQIEEWIEGYTAGRVGDEQMAAWAMAVYLNGMTAVETAALTGAMVASGTRLSRGKGKRSRVDKHSTGGIGDKVSIVLAPLLACCGVDVPMISGRSLGPSGGTLDKLESIPGFRTDLELAEIDRLIADVGCVITGTTADIAPADRRLYALRDVTSTVASVPLITGSILSKKVAEDLDALVFDVKVGSGAFMKTFDQARELADSLVCAGRAYGVETSALITDMSQPLGRAVGNALEIDEAVAALEGEGPEDLVEVTLALGAKLLTAAGVAADDAAARDELADRIADGAGRERLARMVAAQGGDLAEPRPLSERSTITASRSGYVAGFDGEAIGFAVLELGAGRKRQRDAIDPGVGLETQVRIGDRVEVGHPLFTLYGDPQHLASGRLESTIVIEADRVDPPPLIRGRDDDAA